MWLETHSSLWLQYEAMLSQLAKTATNAGSMNSSFVRVGVRKSNGGVRVYLRVTLLSFSTLHCHSVFLARGLGPSHIHNKNRNAPLLQLKFIWHNLSAVIFSLCICRRKTLASILHSCRDQSHRATQKSWRTPQAQTCL